MAILRAFPSLNGNNSASTALIVVMLLLLAGCHSATSESVTSTQTDITAGDSTTAGPSSIAQTEAPAVHDSGARSTGQSPQPASGERGIEIIEEPPRRHALLVGVNTFEDLPQLRFCVQDMRELRDVLVDQGGYDAENVTLLVQDDPIANGEPTREKILDALHQLCDDAGRGDTVLFAFAGHGLEEGGAGFLMPQDGHADDPANSAVPMSEIRGQLSSCVAESKFLIVDACHSGGTRDAGLNQERLLEPGTGIFGLFSCGANQKSYEDEALGHGVFTYYLADALRGSADLPNADGQFDNQVTIDEAFRFVSARVGEHVINGRSIEQTPFRHIEGSGEPVLSVYTVAPIAPDVEMLTLPGLTGQWWFKETPWLLPDVRLELARIQRQETNRLTSDGTILENKDDGLRSSSVAIVQDELRSEFDFVLSQINNNRRKTALGLIAEWGESPPTTATQEQVLAMLEGDDAPYSLAIVQHYLGMPEAEASFEAAVDRQEQDHAMPSGLYARLLADYGQFLLETDRPEIANLQFQHALMQVPREEEAPLFSIECELGRASCFRKLTRWVNAEVALRSALAIASEHVPVDHPMTALIHKSFGWLYMDQWRLSEARDSFLASDAVILQGMIAPSELSVRDQVFLMHNAHGQAMAARYAGDREQAFVLYNELLDEINDAILRTRRTSDRIALIERQINTQERVSDTYLFAPDIGGWEAEAAEFVLLEAASSLNDLPGSVSSVTRARLECKMALASVLAGNPAGALDRLAEFDSMTADLSEESAKRLVVYRQAAEGLALLHQTQTHEAGVAILVELLETAQQDDVRAQYKRDEFDVLLLVGTQLVQAEAAEGLFAALDDEVDSLISFLPAEILQQTAQAGIDTVVDTGAGLIDDPESRAELLFSHIDLLFKALPGEYRQGDAFRYLRGFYDAALSVAFNSCSEVPVEARIRLAEAKTGISTLRGTRPTEPLLIFYVPNGAESGWAVLFPQCAVFPFDLPTEGESSLPPDLQQAISALPRVQIHWSDAIHGWTEEDLPFVVPSSQPSN